MLRDISIQGIFLFIFYSKLCTYIFHLFKVKECGNAASARNIFSLFFKKESAYHCVEICDADDDMLMLYMVPSLTERTF